jgi:hypothetical protein
MKIPPFGKAGWTFSSIVLLIVTSLVDYFTGYELQFFVFYFIPISLASLKTDKATAYSIALASTLCWFVVDFYADHHYLLEWYRLWNTIIRLVSFLLVAHLLDRSRILLVRQKKLNEDLVAALEKVKLLQGILPICCSCKKIRNKNGNWEKLETYIPQHSEADFTHGICPECREKLYPELYKKGSIDMNGGDGGRHS